MSNKLLEWFNMAQQSSRLHRLLTLLDGILLSFLFVIFMIDRTYFTYYFLIMQCTYFHFGVKSKQWPCVMEFSFMKICKLVQRKQQDLLLLGRLGILPNHILKTWPLFWRRYHLLLCLFFSLTEKFIVLSTINIIICMITFCLKF